jgi:hypothetical protein
MHPPLFRLAHRLSDWPDCRLELKCCRGVTTLPLLLLLLMKERGDRTLAEIRTSSFI